METKVKIDGRWYIGDFDEKSLMLKNAQSFSGEDSFKVWLINCNDGSLPDLQLKGLVGYVTKSFTDKELILLESLRQEFTLVKRTAISTLENKIFSNDWR